eukprot:UN15028
MQEDDEEENAYQPEDEDMEEESSSLSEDCQFVMVHQESRSERRPQQQNVIDSVLNGENQT